jgi:hypothetical protein
MNTEVLLAGAESMLRTAIQLMKRQNMGRASRNITNEDAEGEGECDEDAEA